jgi:integrase
MAGKRRRRGFGQGSIRKRGQSWSITWRENGRRRFMSAPDEDTAKRMLSKILSDLALGAVGLKPQLKNGPTLAELAKPWLERRKRTHRAWMDDSSRWKCHLEPFFGKCRPFEVDPGMIRRFVEAKLAEGLAASTCGHCIRLLSTFYADIIEGHHSTANPVASLPRSTRRLYQSTYDTRSTPFLETLADVRRVFLALPEPINVAFACGAFLGLRTAEVLGLRWQDIDFHTRRVHVTQQIQDGKAGPLKDSEPRTVPLMDSLVPILTAWKLKTGGEGLLLQPSDTSAGGRPDIGSPSQFVRPETLRKHLATALDDCGLPSLSWYQCTRHTFASLFVLGGGSLEVLRQLMGHSSVTTTERYAHHKASLYRDTIYTTLQVDLTAPAGTVVPISARSVTNDVMEGEPARKGAETLVAPEERFELPSLSTVSGRYRR